MESRAGSDLGGLEKKKQKTKQNRRIPVLKTWGSPCGVALRVFRPQPETTEVGSRLLPRASVWLVYLPGWQGCSLHFQVEHAATRLSIHLTLALSSEAGVGRVIANEVEWEPTLLHCG